MEIVEVQFVKDTQNRQTGNEFYPSGSRAHFFTNQADILVSQGRAVLYNQSPANVDISPPAPKPRLKITISPKLIDEQMAKFDKPFSKMTVKQLKLCSIAAKIPFTSRTKKAELVAALEEKYGRWN